MTAKTSLFYFGGHLRKGDWKNATKPDLVLLDLRMPIVNGLAVLEWLRGNIPARCTAHRSLKEDREKASVLGAVAYLPKSEAASVTEFVRNWGADGSGAPGVARP